jgi:predicted kinase
MRKALLGYHGWFAPTGPHCSRPVICVTSLNMRKWMRERLERRKKKTEEQAKQPAPPPLQPAYFDGEPSGSPGESGQSEVETEVRAEPQAQREPVSEEPASEEADAGSSTQPTPSGSTQRTRGRRRRGGRGRGGRVREQAVAQAFAPAAGKGAVPEVPPPQEVLSKEAEDAAEDGASESIEPETPAPQVPVPTVIPAAPARPPKGIVVLAIGLPGSGKSSWFKRHNVVPLSSDMVRALLFDDPREQRFQDLVFSNLRSLLKARLIAKRPMNYVDATNLTPQERQHWIKLAKDYNYEVHAVFFDVPLEVCIERHQRRDRVVPEDVMRKMAAKLKSPSFDEGFAKITVVRVKKKQEEPVNAS